MIEEMLTDYARPAGPWHDARAVVEKMLDAEKPIVSAINGVAVGAGLAVPSWPMSASWDALPACPTATPVWEWPP